MVCGIRYPFTFPALPVLLKQFGYRERLHLVRPRITGLTVLAPGASGQ